jgi:hypothetical protein
MSGMSFEWLRHRIAAAAAELYAHGNQHHVRRFPVGWMRRELRARLETALPGTLAVDEADWTPDMATNAPRFQTAAVGIIEAFAAELLATERSELLLGFPAAPFILVLGADDPDLFIEYAEGIQPTRSDCGEPALAGTRSGQCHHGRIRMPTSSHSTSRNRSNPGSARTKNGGSDALTP